MAVHETLQMQCLRERTENTVNEGQRTQLRGIIRIIGRVQSLRTSIQERANLHQMAEASLRAIERQQWAAYSNLPDQSRDVGPDLEIIVAISYIRSEERRVGKECRSRWS